MQWCAVYWQDADGDEEGTQSNVSDDFLLNKELQYRVQKMLGALEVLAYIVDDLWVVLVCFDDAQNSVQTDLAEGWDDCIHSTNYSSHLQNKCLRRTTNSIQLDKNRTIKPALSILLINFETDLYHAILTAE